MDTLMKLKNSGRKIKKAGDGVFSNTRSRSGNGEVEGVGNVVEGEEVASGREGLDDCEVRGEKSEDVNEKASEIRDGGKSDAKGGDIDMDKSVLDNGEDDDLQVVFVKLVRSYKNLEGKEVENGKKKQQQKRVDDGEVQEEQALRDEGAEEKDKSETEKEEEDATPIAGTSKSVKKASSSKVKGTSGSGSVHEDIDQQKEGEGFFGYDSFDEVSFDFLNNHKSDGEISDNEDNGLCFHGLEPSLAVLFQEDSQMGGGQGEVAEENGKVDQGKAGEDQKKAGEDQGKVGEVPGKPTEDHGNAIEGQETPGQNETDKPQKHKMFLDDHEKDDSSLSSEPPAKKAFISTATQTTAIPCPSTTENKRDCAELHEKILLQLQLLECNVKLLNEQCKNMSK